MNTKTFDFKANLLTLAAISVFAVTAHGADQTQPDNSKVNERDRSTPEVAAVVTAEDQGNSKRDIALTTIIRKEVTSHSSLSVDAQNIKVISKNGLVILRGSVKSKAEKVEIEKIATRVAGASKVTSLIEVKAQ